MSDTVRVTVSLPGWLYRQLAAAKKLLRRSRSSSTTLLNLLGDRDIEWSWVAANLPEGSGRALDFGCGTSFLGLAAAQAGYSVIGYDLGQVEWHWRHQRMSFCRGDILDDRFDAESFDLIINCSAVEHVGLSGRYGVETADENGDLTAMERLFDSLRPGGLMLLTVPVGRDAVFEPVTRVYGTARLPRLIEGFDLLSETYWVKDGSNKWIQCDRANAVAFDAYGGSMNPLENCYGLGCLKLRRPGAAKQPE